MLRQLASTVSAFLFFFFFFFPLVFFFSKPRGRWRRGCGCGRGCGRGLMMELIDVWPQAPEGQSSRFPLKRLDRLVMGDVLLRLAGFDEGQFQPGRDVLHGRDLLE